LGFEFPFNHNAQKVFDELSSDIHFCFMGFFAQKYINMSLDLRVTHVTCHIAKDELTKDDQE